MASYADMARMGDFEDNMIAHVSPGEYVIPKPILDANPQLARYITQVISQAGVDPRKFQVGSHMDRNQQTGAPEFGWWKKFRRVIPALAAFVISGGNPYITAAAAAAATKARGGSWGQAAQSAGYGFGGSGVANAGLNAAVTGLQASGAGLAPGAAGPVSSGMGTAGIVGKSLYSSATSALAPTSAAGKVFQALSLAGGMGGAPKPQREVLSQQRIGNPAPSAGEVPQFFPQRPQAMNRPSALNELAGFSPEQERSYLATRGKNTGLGSEEQSYYDNLVQRSLIGEGGQVNTENPNWLMPIESSYYSGQGRNTSSVMEFLRQLHG